MSVNVYALTRLVRAAALSLILALLTLGLTRAASATVYYVSPTGTGNGSSWATAGPFQPILSAAHSGDQVWALKGIYVGNFTAKDGVAVYGGFAGTETSITQRNISRNVSYLDANGSGTVYTIPSAAAGTNTLDGFTIESGTNRGVYDPSGDKLVISNCTVTNNNVTDSSGGGIYANGSSVTVTGCTFTNNNVYTNNNTTVYGGGLYAASGTNTTISNCTFTGNGAIITNYGGPAYGGGIYTAGNATISNCTLSSNTASSYDSGMSLHGNSSTVTTCTFTGNTNCGLVSTGANTSVSGCAFNSNTGRGMALLGPNSSTVSNCTFATNTATDASGGGLYTSDLVATITQCTFTGNIAYTNNNTAVYGGGLYTESGTNTTISDCTFTGNSTKITNYSGPAFAGGLGAFGTPYIMNCTFMNNSPSEIDLLNVGSPSSPAYVIDNLIYGAGTGAGNGINLATNGSSTGFAYATISNNTILGASAAINIGSGSTTGGAVSVANNIFYANAGAVNDNSSVTFVSSHNDLYQNTGYTYQGSGITLSPTDLMVDPKFVRNPNFAANPVDYGDLHLTTASPLINAGDDSYVSPGDTDRDGNPRIVGSHVDIGAYEYQGAPTTPTITSFTPTSGPVGTSVTITGTNFTGATAVKFNTTAATTFHVVSPTSITATVPTGATTGTISVTTPAGTATSPASFTVTAAAPTITGFSPSSGPVGTTVVITGTNLTGATVVGFTGAHATSFTVNSSTQITTTVPSGAQTGPIAVATPGGTAHSSASFTVTSTAPTITSFTPTSGPIGTTVTITGTNFTGATAVKFDGTAAATFHVVSATSITATVPTGAATGAITVTTPSGTATSTTSFTVTAPPAPTVKSLTFSPSTIAPGGTSVGTVTLSGAAPTGGASVTILEGPFSYATVAVAAGQTTGTFTVATVTTAPVGTYSFTAAYNSTSASATLTVANPPTVKTLAFSPSTIAPGGTSTGTVTLSSAALPGGAAVSISQGPFAFETVTVAAGQTTATFTVMAMTSAPAGSYPFTATYNGTSATAMLTIN